MRQNNVEEVACSSVEDFIQKISYGGDLYKLIDSRYIYRGESSDKYKLIPSALREENHKKIVNSVKTFFPSYNYKNENSEHFQMVAEYIYLHEFYLFCDYRGLHVPNIKDFREKLIGQVYIENILKPYFTWLPVKYIEIAGLAQHYGVYTRLLDWSRDINVALYFAISGLINIKGPKPTNIVLWVLDTTAIQVPEQESPGIELYTPEYAGNPNLCAQKGVFSLYRVYCNFQNRGVISFMENDKEVKPLDEIIKEIDEGNPNQAKLNNENPILYKILIPSPQDDELYEYLFKQGYDASLIFPGYEGATKTIKDDLYWRSQKLKHKQ